MTPDPVPAAPSPLRVLHRGLLPFREAWELQKLLFRDRLAGKIPDTLLLVEHPPTITLGRGGNREHLLATPEELARKQVDVVDIDRGGDITYHGPGQIVGYPILDLSALLPDLHRYVRALEAVMIETLSLHGLEAVRVPGMTGIWCRGMKAGAIGVKVKRWVTMHGFALNVSTDLTGFKLIVPCGLQGKQATSMQQLLGRSLDLAMVRSQLVGQFLHVLGLEQVQSSHESNHPLLPEPQDKPSLLEGRSQEV